MADLSSMSELSGAGEVSPEKAEAGSTPTPRATKVFVLLVALVAVAVIVVFIVGSSKGKGLEETTEETDAATPGGGGSPSLPSVPVDVEAPTDTAATNTTEMTTMETTVMETTATETTSMEANATEMNATTASAMEANMTVPEEPFSALNCSVNYGPRDTGDIVSPNYPNNYPSNVHMVWCIVAIVGRRIRMVFNAMDMEPDCTHDNLTIYDDGGPQPAKLAELCGHTLPQPVTSKTNKVYMVMETNEDTEFTGFNLTFSWT